MQYISTLKLQNLTVEKFEATVRKAFDGSITFVSIFARGLDFFNFCRRCIASHEDAIFSSQEKLDAITNSDMDLMLTEGIEKGEAFQLRNWRSFWD
ncbi:MAG: hypothetical protein ACLFSQ_10280 [Candidatus Zixiibacteriota bacterium]